MVFDEEMLLKHYFSLHEKISELRKVLKKPLTLSEKILSAFPNNSLLEIKSAVDKLLINK